MLSSTPASAPLRACGGPVEPCRWRPLSGTPYGLSRPQWSFHISIPTTRPPDADLFRDQDPGAVSRSGDPAGVAASAGSRTLSSRHLGAAAALLRPVDARTAARHLPGLQQQAGLAAHAGPYDVRQVRRRGRASHCRAARFPATDRRSRRHGGAGFRPGSGRSAR